MSVDTRRTVVVVLSTIFALVGGGVAAAQTELDWSLEYDKKAKRFVARAADASICDRYGEGATMTDDGSGCWYAPTLLGFLPALGFGGDANGFTVSDRTDDVLVFMEGRSAPQPRFDITALDWAVIEADTALLEAAPAADGAVVGEAYDATPGPRIAVFAHLNEPPIWDGDTINLNVNTYVDEDLGNDITRSLDPSSPSGGGDTNIAAGWSYLDDETVRAPSVNVWSQIDQSLIPGNHVAGPSEDPPGIWAIYGPEHFGDNFNALVISQPLYSPTLIDRAEGTRGAFASFELDGNTQAYLDGFTMEGTANIPGKDFQLVFHTPYAPLFKGGTATIGFLMDGEEQTFSADYETTASEIRLGLSLPTGPTGLTGIEFKPSPKAKVRAANLKKPMKLKKWARSDQVAEFNAAVQEIMALSMSSRFELADGQEISLGATPSGEAAIVEPEPAAEPEEPEPVTEPEPVATPEPMPTEADWSLRYDDQTRRFMASKSEGSICDGYGEGATMTDDGSGCWYAPTLLGFLPALGFEGDANGFTASDRTDDVLVFMESRPAEPQRFDITAMDWAVIEADAALLEGAAAADGAVVGEAFDPTPGPRTAIFLHLSEPLTDERDSLSWNTNIHADDDITNDFVRSLDPSFPNGGGDTNIAAGWQYNQEVGVREPVAVLWSNAVQAMIPGNIVAGMSEDPPGVWSIIGSEHSSDRFNAIILTGPHDSGPLMDRVEGSRGPFGSFELDGNTQAYLDGFTMMGTANSPGIDFRLVFHTPYAPLFEGGAAEIGFLMDAEEQSFSKEVATTDTTIELGISLPTGPTGLTSIEFSPSAETKVAVEDRDEPVELAEWLEGDQLAEFNAAVEEIMALSMSSRFELADGQEVSLGAGPS